MTDDDFAAIPDDVLIQLAIKRGVLKWVEVGSDIDGSIFIFGSGIHRTLEPHDSMLWWEESPQTRGTDFWDRCRIREAEISPPADREESE